MNIAETSARQSSDREPIYRRNFIFFLADNILFNLAMDIVGPTTLIPDFIRHLTRSEILIGLSSSLFDVGSTLPQLLIVPYLLRIERMKWWFVGPNIPARLLMLGFPAMIVVLGKDRPEAVLLAFLICYGIAALGNGITNVPVWLLAATSLDSRWRARWLGLTTASVGVLMLGAAPLIGLVLSSAGPGYPNNYAWLFGAAGLLFFLSIWPMIFIHELPGGTVAKKIPSLAEYLPSLGHVLRTDAPFRAILVTRILTTMFAMASPFYIGFATVQLGLSSTIAVPVLLAMQTIGSVGGALFYSWLGARHNVLYMRLALGVAALLPVSALLAAATGPLPLYFGFLVSGLTVAHLFGSYTNWVITYAAPAQRPMYAGLFNTIGAIILLMAPLLGGTIVQQLGYEALFVVALAMVFGALFVALRYIQSPLPAEAS